MSAPSWASGALPEYPLQIAGLALALTLAGGAMLATSAGMAAAGVYRWTDAEGRVHFSDVPAPGARRQRLGTASAIANPDYNLERSMRRIPYEEADGGMLVAGEADGVRLRFIVDTGASIVVIPPAVARQAGLDVLHAPRIRMQTANGEVRAPLVRLARLRVGDLVVRDVRAAVQDVGGDGRMGLLGMNVLGRFVMKVDREHRVLLLEEK